MQEFHDYQFINVTVIILLKEILFELPYSLFFLLFLLLHSDPQKALSLLYLNEKKIKLFRIFLMI